MLTVEYHRKRLLCKQQVVLHTYEVQQTAIGDCQGAVQQQHVNIT